MQLSLSHRERVCLALDHKPVDRIPVSMIGSYINAAPRARLENYLQQTRGMSVDAFLAPIIDLRAVAPAYKGPNFPANTDYWGVSRMPVMVNGDQYDEIDYYPLRNAQTVDDIMAHTWPTTDWFDYSGISEQIDNIWHEGDYAIWLYGPASIFETTWYMRGFEQTFIDFTENPELVDCIMAKVTEFCINHNRKALEMARGKIDLVYTSDDIAGQTGPLMSPDMWQRFIKPHHQQLNRMIHQFDARVIYHSDGAVMDMVPELIKMGIDILEALQFDADGMDPVILKESYGEWLGFAGGLSVQKTLPFGTVDEVKKETRQLIHTLGRGGGYLFGPSHAIQNDTSPENIVAMFEEAIVTEVI